MFDAIDWQPGIGDPTFMGWFTVFAYIAAAALCLRTARAVESGVAAHVRGREPRVWRAAAIFLVVLGINKQLDLQTLFTQIGRAVLTANGWMPERRQIQVDFMIGLTATAALVLAVALWVARRRIRAYGLLFAGAACSTTFILARAASFHRFDRFLGTYVSGVKMNWALELSGIGMMAAAAWTRRRALRRPSSAAP